MNTQRAFNPQKHLLEQEAEHEQLPERHLAPPPFALANPDDESNPNEGEDNSTIDVTSSSRTSGEGAAPTHHKPKSTHKHWRSPHQKHAHLPPPAFALKAKEMHPPHPKRKPPKALEKEGQQLDQAKVKAEKAGKKGGKKNKGAMAEVEQTIQTAQKTFDKTVGKLGKTIEKIYKKTDKKIKKAEKKAKKAKKAVKGKGSILKKAVKKIVKALKKALKKLRKLAKKLVKKGIQAAVKLVKKLLKKLLNKIVKILKQLVSKQLGKAYKELESLVNTALDTAGDMAKKVVSQIAEQVGEEIGNVVSTMQEMFDATVNFYSTMGEGTLEMLNAVMEGDFLALAKICFTTVCDANGMPGDELWDLIEKAKGEVITVASDPIDFTKNLFAAIEKGSLQFLDNIVPNVQTGLVGWLFSQVEGEGIDIPTEITKASMFKLLMQALGLTYEYVHERIVMNVGEENAERLEIVLMYFQMLFEEGPEAV
ncbi:MAG: hypothetical protein AAF570_04055, partial [Bacteroidota bacterium]